MKQLLLLFTFSLAVLFSKAQGGGDPFENELNWLNANVGITHRYGSLTFDQTWFFMEKGLLVSNGSRDHLVRWNQVAALSPTTTGRLYVSVRVAPGDKDYTGTGYYPPEYITPKPGVAASEFMQHMLSALNQMGYTEISGTRIIAGDADEAYVKEKEQAGQQQLSAEDQALLSFIDLVAQAHWEIGGAGSFDQMKSQTIAWSSTYEPVERYSMGEVRVTWAFGNKHFRFNVSPFAFTWMTLPSYTKYDEQGSQIAYEDFGVTRYYSPALGFSWAMFPKKKDKTGDPSLEFPLSLNFAPLLGNGKTEKEIVKNDIYDSEFASYFEGMKYNLHGTLGVNVFAGEHAGFGLALGGTFVNAKATKETLTETLSNGEQQRFTYRFDKLPDIIPTLQLKLILR